MRFRFRSNSQYKKTYPCTTLFISDWKWIRNYAHVDTIIFYQVSRSKPSGHIQKSRIRIKWLSINNFVLVIFCCDWSLKNLASRAAIMSSTYETCRKIVLRFANEGGFQFVSNSEYFKLRSIKVDVPHILGKLSEILKNQASDTQSSQAYWIICICVTTTGCLGWRNLREV
jgi:hypothetical protein